MSDFLNASRYASGAAFVAGGSGGLGAAICKVLAEAGADVALTFHRNRDGAERAAGDVRAAGRKAHIVELDLAKDEEVAHAVSHAATMFGGIHTAIYAAGPYVDMRFVGQIAPAHFRETVGGDLFGCYNLLHAVLPELRKSRGAFVALSSAATHRFLKKDILSVAPKAAVETLVKAIAAEEGRYGVRANGIGVGVIADGMYHALREKGDFSDRVIEETRKALPLGRLGTAQEIADAVAFLCCDRAGFITGQTLVVDGGFAL